jgi:hypothetical protein
LPVGRSPVVLKRRLIRKGLSEVPTIELGDLKELGFDLTLTGFDEIQLGAFLADKTEGLTDPDDAPEPPAHRQADLAERGHCDDLQRRRAGAPAGAATRRSVV